MQDTTNTLPSFSLIELIFAVLIIGILSTVALPKFFENTSNSVFIKLSTDVASIQNGIKKYSDSCMMQNIPIDLETLENSDTTLFGKILSTPIQKTTTYPYWSKQNDTSYLFHFDSKINLKFRYNKDNFTFSCDTKEPLCQKVL